ncbi:MAG: AgmX/PglI C-terminal domain-containing protein [Nitrospinae bacterium]|nr:AgmX/PglI C-terminal domain-containing protein [Nitrospinota bacterium]
MVKKRKVFFVSLHKTGKGVKEFFPEQFLSIGKKPDCEINPVPGFSEGHKLIEKSKIGYNLIIPADLEGTIARGEIILPLKGIIGFGFLKKKGNSYIFPLTTEECIFKLAGHTFTFGYKEIVPSEKKPAKIDKLLKRPWITREDYSFLVIFLLSTIINFSTVGYLNSLEIKKEKPIDAIKKIPQRFAKLILQPPQKKVLKTAIDKMPIEKKEEKVENKKEDENKKEEIKPSDEVKEIDTVKKGKEEIQDIENHEKEVAMLNPPEKLTSSINREAVREKVKTKGLLGVIMAKALPDEVSSDIVFRDIDKIVKGIEKGSGDKEGEGLLDIRGSGKTDDLSKKINETTRKIKQRDTSEIIAEKREIIKEELNKNKEGLSSAERKRNEAEVYRTVSTYIGGLKYLYNNTLRKNPSLKGKITVKIVISQDGKVVKSEVVSSTLGFPELEEAIINRIYRWRFSELDDVEDFTIDYTFDFAPVG